VINSLRGSGTNGLSATTNGSNGSSSSVQTVSSPDLQRKDSPTSWDEFPNGRFGDARSPAYGDMDGSGYSPSFALQSLTPHTLVRDSPPKRSRPGDLRRLSLMSRKSSLPTSEVPSPAILGPKNLSDPKPPRSLPTSSR
jgi:hypothetical protein